MKELRCGDVVPGCDHKIRADTEGEVLQRAAEHARKVHQIEPTPTVVNKVKAAIHDAA